MGYLSSIAKRSIYDGGTLGAAKWDRERGIIKRSLSLSFAFNTNSSLSPQFPRRVWHPTKYTVTAIWALRRSVRIRQTIFRPPSRRICVLVDAKKGSRSLIGQGDVPVSIGKPGGPLDDLCVMLVMSRTTPNRLSLMRDDTRQRARALC